MVQIGQRKTDQLSPGADLAAPGAQAGIAPPGPAVVDARLASASTVPVERVRREQFRLLLGSWGFRIGIVILLVWIVCAVFGDLFRPYDPLTQDLTAINQGPSGEHYFGTDGLGRDMFSRVITGAREVMVIAPLATILATAFGTVLGLFQGYYRGVLDAVTGRIVEAILALPSVIVVFLFIVAVGPSKASMIVVIGFAFGLAISRTVRTAVLQERQLDYIAAARLRGEGAWHTMFVEILPNVMSPITVEFTVRLGYAINAAATLSFLGFGVQPPTPDWGADISANAQFLSAGLWWGTVFPALAIATLITSISLIGDSIESSVQ